MKNTESSSHKYSISHYAVKFKPFTPLTKPLHASVIALAHSTDGLQIHHAVHRGQGGNNTMHNLITLCWRCHAQAHGTPVFDHSELTEADISLACVEYLADYYAPEWMPYRPDWWYRYTHPVR